MTQLTDDQLAAAEREMNSTREPLPSEQPARFDRRVTCIMNATGKGRSWARQRAAEQWPEEHQAFLASRA